MRNILNAAMAILLFPVIIFSQTQISLSLSDNSGTIGDRIRADIVIKTSLKTDNIKFRLTGGEFEKISESGITKEKDRNNFIIRKSFIISFFRTGDFKVGPVTADLMRGKEIIETRESNTVSIIIRSVLTEKDKDIRPPKDPAEINGNPLYVLKYFIFLLILFLILFLIYRYIKGKKKSIIKVKPQLHPLEEFERNIRKLWETIPRENRKYKKFFLRLSSVYRGFLSGYYLFNAEDLTTAEISEFLNSKEDDPGVLKSFEEIFYLSDVVKFAKYIPAQEDMAEVKKKLDLIISVLKRREEIKKESEEKNSVST